jgi:hypothetical protein
MLPNCCFPVVVPTYASRRFTLYRRAVPLTASKTVDQFVAPPEVRGRS